MVTLQDIGENMEKLINVSNHRVTKLEVNVKWLTKLAWWQLGLIGATFTAVLGLAVKLIV